MAAPTTTIADGVNVGEPTTMVTSITQSATSNPRIQITHSQTTTSTRRPTTLGDGSNNSDHNFTSGDDTIPATGILILIGVLVVVLLVAGISWLFRRRRLQRSGRIAEGDRVELHYTRRLSTASTVGAPQYRQ